jgi:hypothetical protein
MSTKEIPGPFDAFEKAERDELIFTLLERDLDAPATILHWVDRRRKRAFEAHSDPMAFGPDGMPEALRNELRQCAEAEMIAIEMISRQKGGKAEKVKAHTYSGNVNPTAEMDGLMAKLRAMLGNADYHANLGLETMAEIAALDPGKIGAEIAERLEAAIKTIHHITLELSPHRAAYLAEGELPLPGVEAAR